MPDEIIEAIEPDKTKQSDSQTKMMDYDDCYVPYGVTTFADLMAMKDAKYQAKQVSEMASQFKALIENIFMSDDIEDKAAAVQSLAAEFATMIDNPPMTKEKWQPLTNAAIKLRDKIVETVTPKPVESITTTDSPFSVWYNKETGQYRWLAIYSNKFRDNDNPPEIISDASHRNFTKSVESGLIPYPELWLWHLKTSSGKADWIAYTDEGFSLASGYFHKDKEHHAKGLMSYEGNLLVSHGMPSAYIKRDSNDKSIIIDHVTREISPLPDWAAANKLTQFELLRKEIMPIPDEKKEFLKGVGLSDEEIQQVEGAIKEKANQAEEEKIEHKEVESIAPDDIIKAMQTMIEPLVKEIGTLKAQVSALTQDDEAKIKEVVANTPKSSLQALAAKSVEGLFGPDTLVDGRSSLAKSKPKEATKEQSGLFFQQWMQPAAKEDVNV